MFKLAASGRGPPEGHNVTNDDSDGSVTATFNATAPTPDAGTPPRPSTSSSMVSWAPRRPAPTNRPSTVTPSTRVSNTRAGTTPTYPPTDAGASTTDVASAPPGCSVLAD